MIFSLTDETFSLLVKNDFKVRMSFLISFFRSMLLDHWFFGGGNNWK